MYIMMKTEIKTISFIKLFLHVLRAFCHTHIHSILFLFYNVYINYNRILMYAYINANFEHWIVRLHVVSLIYLIDNSKSYWINNIRTNMVSLTLFCIKYTLIFVILVYSLNKYSLLFYQIIIIYKRCTIHSIIGLCANPIFYITNYHFMYQLLYVTIVLQ